MEQGCPAGISPHRLPPGPGCIPSKPGPASRVNKPSSAPSSAVLPDSQVAAAVRREGLSLSSSLRASCCRLPRTPLRQARTPEALHPPQGNDPECVPSLTYLSRSDSIGRPGPYGDCQELWSHASPPTTVCRGDPERSLSHHISPRRVRAEMALPCLRPQPVQGYHRSLDKHTGHVEAMGTRRGGAGLRYG